MTTVVRPSDELAPGVRILVYLINGNKSLLIRATPHWRRVIRYRGKFCVRDHGLLPLIGKTETGTWHT